MSLILKTSIIIGILSVCQFSFGQGRRSGWGGSGGSGGDRSGSSQDFRSRRGGGDRGGGDRGGGGSSGPASGDDIAQRLSRTEDFLKRLDTNHNGIIDPEEASDGGAKFMLDRIFSRMGKEPHYPMAISEILRQYEGYLRTSGNTTSSGSPSPSASPPSGSSPAAGWASPPGMGFGSPAAPASGSSFSASKPVIASVSLVPAANLAIATPSGPTAAPAASSPSAAASPAADAKPVPRMPSRFKTPQERLPKGLPAWFLAKADADGQITMAEFTDNWTPEKVAEFARYDLNHDGIITAAECLKVEKAKGGSK